MNKCESHGEETEPLQEIQKRTVIVRTVCRGRAALCYFRSEPAPSSPRGGGTAFTATTQYEHSAVKTRRLGKTTRPNADVSRTLSGTTYGVVCNGPWVKRKRAAKGPKVPRIVFPLRRTRRRRRVSHETPPGDTGKIAAPPKENSESREIPSLRCAVFSEQCFAEVTLFYYITVPEALAKAPALF